jgi:hypothetical protein
MAKPKGKTTTCNKEDGRKRLIDARQFIEAAEILESPDVIATNAIHGAIAASDAITCNKLGQRSNDGNHSSAVKLLHTVEPKLATALKRALEQKTKAGYQSTDISESDARMCLEQAKKILEAARTLFK